MNPYTPKTQECLFGISVIYNNIKKNHVLQFKSDFAYVHGCIKVHACSGWGVRRAEVKGVEVNEREVSVWNPLFLSLFLSLALRPQ